MIDGKYVLCDYFNVIYILNLLTNLTYIINKCTKNDNVFKKIIIFQINKSDYTEYDTFRI